MLTKKADSQAIMDLEDIAAALADALFHTFEAAMTTALNRHSAKRSAVVNKSEMRRKWKVVIQKIAEFAEHD